jgi:hypothetical protein
MGELMLGVADWEEWLGETQPKGPRRSEREEKYLWAMLRVLDKESAGEERRLKVKQKKVVAKARKRMGVGKNQPSILDIMKSRASRVVPQPTSRAVPQPLPAQVQARAVPQPTSGAVPQPLPAQAQARAVPQLIQTQAPTQADQAEQPHTLAHPISQPQESSEAFARIGLVPDEVGPKKLKTGEHNQQPRPAVEPLLGVVRGVRGVQVVKSEVEGGGCVNTQTGSVSVAGSQSNTVVKANGEGGSSVNTQTGSVSVAGSQSNTVIKAIGEGGSSVNTQTGSVSVAGSQSNIVQTDASMESRRMNVKPDASVVRTGSSVEIDARMIETVVSENDASVVDCVKYEKTECVQPSVCVQTAGRAGRSQTGSSNDKTPSILVAGRSIRAKFKLSKIEGGRFSLKVNSTEKKEGPVMEGEYENDSDRVPISKSFENIENTVHARNKFRGENNTFNNIELIIKTPKRKKENTVAKLVCRFSDSACNLPGVEFCDESPAKRRRLWGQGGQGH